MDPDAVAPPQGPLSMMSKISPIVYLYRPSAQPTSKTASTSETASPKLILVCSWMGARDQHIAKYIMRYQAAHPTSQILLIRCELVHVRNPERAVREIQPALPALRAVFRDGSDAAGTSEPLSTPEMLVHLFSNGGSSMLCHLYSASKPLTLPRHVTVFDSAPGRYNYQSSLAAISSGASGKWSFLLAPLFHALVISYYVKHFLFPWNWGRLDSLAQWAAMHNDPGLNRAEARRSYIYSREDKLVGSEAVEEHGQEAKRRGFNVRMERFDGSEHVAHMRADAERYWRIVEETWRGSV